MVNHNLCPISEQIASDIYSVMLIGKVIILGFRCIYNLQTRKRGEGKFFVNLKEYKPTRIIYSEQYNLQVI